MEHLFEVATTLFTLAVTGLPVIAFKHREVYDLIEREYALTIGALFVGLCAILMTTTAELAPPGYLFAYLAVLLLEVAALHDLLVLLAQKKHERQRDED